MNKWYYALMYITKFVGHERDLQANNNARLNDVLIKCTIPLIKSANKLKRKYVPWFQALNSQIMDWQTKIEKYTQIVCEKNIMKFSDV